MPISILFTRKMSNSDDSGSNELRSGQPENRSHLRDVEDGCGCVEVWEHLSEQRTTD